MGTPPPGLHPLVDLLHLYTCNFTFNFNFIELVACTILNKNETKRKITSATGAENRAMSLLIFNPNRSKK